MGRMEEPADIDPKVSNSTKETGIFNRIKKQQPGYSRVPRPFVDYRAIARAGSGDLIDEPCVSTTAS